MIELLGAGALVAITATLIVWPLLRGDGHPGAPAPSSRERAQLAALAAVRELEFDYQTGKISAKDYTVLRARYEAKAAEAMAEGPERAQRVEGAAPQTPPQRDLEADIEALVAAVRTQRRCAVCGETLPAAANFCPGCGAVAGAEGPERAPTSRMGTGS